MEKSEICTQFDLMLHWNWFNSRNFPKTTKIFVDQNRNSKSDMHSNYMKKFQVV